MPGGIGIGLGRGIGSAGSTIEILYSQYETYENTTTEITTTEYLQDGSVIIRKRTVGNALHIDMTISPEGFSGTEGVDWTNLVIYEGQTPNFRMGSRGGNYVIDCEITATGFGGSEGVDWENLLQFSHPTSAETTYRDGVRSGNFVIDQALNVTGFSGSEGTDWENLIEQKQ